jgi:hypothetical protein
MSYNVFPCWCQIVSKKLHLIIISDNLLSPAEILGNLHQIVNDNTPFPEHPLGILTCQDRDKWAKQRSHIEATGNKDALHKIDSALFNLVLDNDSLQEDKHKILKHYLHGDGLNR